MKTITKSITNTINFYFKINNSKLDKPKTLERQIKLVSSRLIEKHGFDSETFSLKVGTTGDDFIRRKSSLRFSFKRNK